MERIRRNPLSNVRADAKALSFSAPALSSVSRLLSEKVCLSRFECAKDRARGYYNISNFRMVQMLDC